jgi:peptide/nickel transport system permease protein
MRRILRYVAGRLLLTIPMIFVLVSLIFVILRIMPGDPVSVMLGEHALPEYLAQKKHELGLDKPIAAQYLDYLGQLAKGDLGKSMNTEERVGPVILEKLPATLELTFFGLAVCLAIGIPLGVRAARRRRSGQDFGIRLYANVVYCIPVFWMGLMLQLIFSLWFGVFPIAGRTGSRVIVSDFDVTGLYVIDTLMHGDLEALGDVLWHLALPAITLGVTLSGIFVRLTRANMLDALKADYVLASRARGIAEGKVVYGHALKNALIPIVTMLGLQFSALLAGAILTETTFSWPGMGRLLLERIYNRDYPVIQGVIIIYALIVSVVSLIVDLLYAIIDPRVKL